MIRVILISLAAPHKHVDIALKDLKEIQSLIKTYGGIDVVRIIQHRIKPDKNTFVGSGKVEEIKEIIRREKIDTIILNDLVNHSQIFHLTKSLWIANPNIKVWDRIDLILNIFSKHAKTAEAKLQIEIAQIKHMGPRIYGLGGLTLSRQGGGIGTRGLGETNVEVMKRHWTNQIRKKNEELKKIERIKQKQLERRKENGLKSISIIGYTNAGKTSLFNLLTKKNKSVKDALFITLDSTSGKLFDPKLQKSVIITDTIGFMKNLPSNLIQAFKSTFMESMNSDLIVHLIDICDEEIQTKVEVVENLMKDLQIQGKKRLYVFNKIDKLNGQRHIWIKKMKNDYSRYSPIFISIEEKTGIEKLKKTLFNSIFY